MSISTRVMSRLRSLAQRLERLTSRAPRQRTGGPRLAKTWSSSEANYPAVPANTFDIVFLDGEFTETPGDQTATFTARSATPQAVAHVIPGDYFNRGTVVIVEEDNGQWWIKRKLCGEGCDWHFDDFNRSDSTDVGGDYTEVSGDWSISSTALLVQANNAQLDIDVAHPNGLANGVCGFVLYAFDYDDEVRFIFNYVDADNYYFVQTVAGDLHFDDPVGSGKVEIWQRSSGVNSRLQWASADLAPDEFRIIWIYWGTRPDATAYIAAKIPRTTFGVTQASYVELTGVSFSADGVALGTGTITSAVFFDQLVLYRHYASSRTECPYIDECWLQIDSVEPSAEITASFAGGPPVAVFPFSDQVPVGGWVWRYNDGTYDHALSIACGVDFDEVSLGGKTPDGSNYNSDWTAKRKLTIVDRDVTDEVTLDIYQGFSQDVLLGQVTVKFNP